MNKKFWTPVLQFVAGSVIFALLCGIGSALLSEVNFHRQVSQQLTEQGSRLAAIESKLGITTPKESVTHVAINP